MGYSALKYYADDGTTFDTEVDMMVYELSLLNQKEIQLYVEQISNSPRQITEYTRVITAWENFKTKQKIEKTNEPEAGNAV